MLNLNSLLIGSEDSARLSEFYGMVLQSGPDWMSDGFVGYQTDGCFLVIGPHDKVLGMNATPERLLFNFETTDIMTDFNRIKMIDGAGVIQDPYSPGADPTMQLATFADPDGNYFQLATPMTSK